MRITQFLQQANQWRLCLRRLAQPQGQPITPAEQMLVQVGDAYFWVEGAQRVRVAPDQPWLPEHAVWAAGV